jgi:Cd2+/Zn2+-exporting ATPase
MGVAGAAAAMETADVALLTNDLSRVAETIAIGRGSHSFSLQLNLSRV